MRQRDDDAGAFQLQRPAETHTVGRGDRLAFEAASFLFMAVGRLVQFALRAPGPPADRFQPGSANR